MELVHVFIGYPILCSPVRKKEEQSTEVIFPFLTGSQGRSLETSDLTKLRDFSNQTLFKNDLELEFS